MQLIDINLENSIHEAQHHDDILLKPEIQQELNQPSPHNSLVVPFSGLQNEELHWFCRLHSTSSHENTSYTRGQFPRTKISIFNIYLNGFNRLETKGISRFIVFKLRAID